MPGGRWRKLEVGKKVKESLYTFDLVDFRDGDFQFLERSHIHELVQEEEDHQTR
jgi:hypothetical protein